MVIRTVAAVPVLQLDAVVAVDEVQKAADAMSYNKKTKRA